MTKSVLTFFQHANFKTFHEATGLARLASPFGDLTFIGGGTAVLNIPCRRLKKKTSPLTLCAQRLHINK